MRQNSASTPHFNQLFNKMEITESWPYWLDYNSFSDLCFNLKPYLSLKTLIYSLYLNHLISLSLHSFSFYESKPILTTLTTRSLLLSTQPLNPYSQALILYTYTNNLSPILKIIQWFNCYNNWSKDQCERSNPLS